MPHKQLTLCYLTQKINAIGAIASHLQKAFPKVIVLQASSLDDVTEKEFDLIITDSNAKNFATSHPVLYIVPDCDASGCTHSDFITESEMSSHALARAVKGLLDKRKLTDELKEAVVKDELTGIYNQRFMLEILSRETKKAKRYNYPLTILYIGLDGLKNINVKYGPEAGDKILIDTGLILKNSLREVDTVGRFYGDEFLAILPETSDKNAYVVCERIQKAVRHYAFLNGEATVTTSIGIASMSMEIKSPQEMLSAARKALAFAKKSAPNSILNYDETKLIEEPARENRELILTVKQNIIDITNDAKKTYFDGIIKIFHSLPMHLKLFTHSEHVAFFSEKLAQEMGLAKDDQIMIRHSAILHDIGKFAIDERIILKNGPLSNTEYAIMKQHPVFAAQMLSEAAFIKNEVNTILHHHEHFDGSGYPDHMQGQNIPLAARIIGLVEAWDAMISTQCYREALSIDQALGEVKKGAGGQFDPELVQVFTKLIEN